MTDSDVRIRVTSVHFVERGEAVRFSRQFANEGSGRSTAAPRLAISRSPDRGSD